MEKLVVRAYNQINDNEFDVYINCTSDKKDLSNKLNIRLAVEDNGDDRQYKILYDLLVQNDCEIFQLLNSYLSQNKRCCIFCNQGRQRSCTVYVCFLIYNGYTVLGAIEHLKRCKMDAFFGNVNFMETINLFYNYTKNIS